MTLFFEYPKASRFGRVLPKKKIYEHANAGAKLKQLFVDQVDQIVWAYKLAPETTNLPAVSDVPEIQVFEIKLRGSDFDREILCAIERSIPFPLIFELLKNGERMLAAAYKRPSEAGSKKWVASEYFETEWEPSDAARDTLPRALDLGALYDRVLSGLMPVKPKEGESLPQRVARIEAIREKVREIARIKARLAREKQFNKKVSINAELRKATAELKRLDDGVKTDIV